MKKTLDPELVGDYLADTSQAMLDQMADEAGITLNTSKGYDVARPQGVTRSAVLDRIAEYGLLNPWYTVDHSLGVYHACQREIREHRSAYKIVLGRSGVKRLRGEVDNHFDATRSWATGMTAILSSEHPTGIAVIPQGIDVISLGRANVIEWVEREGEAFGSLDGGKGLIINTYRFDDVAIAVNDAIGVTSPLTPIGSFAFHIDHAESVGLRIFPNLQAIKSENRTTVLTAIREQMNIILAALALDKDHQQNG